MKVFLVGKMTSGKTTLAQYLVTHHKFIKISLSDPIKAIEHDLHNRVDYADIIQKHLSFLDSAQKIIFYKILEETNNIPREEPKPRKRLQFIGTDGARKRISQDIWIQLAEWAAAGYENIIIDDVRFCNEYEFFQKRNWIPIKIIVDESVQKNRIKTLYENFDEKVLLHLSELDIDKIFDTYSFVATVDTSSLSDEEGGKKLAEALKL